MVTWGIRSKRAKASLMHRVIVTASPKSGSTYVAASLKRYLKVDLGNAELDIRWPGEQNFNAEILAKVERRSFVLQMHMLPHPENLAACAANDIDVVVVWRNVGDVVIAFDDHLRLEGPLEPVCPISDRGRYFALSDDQRYAYLIRHALPWYVTFYLMWRRQRRQFFTYEEMVTDPERFFGALLDVLGVPVDEARVAAALEDRKNVRFNVGIAGRSLALSCGNRRLIEDLLLTHPEHAQLEVLLWELPWRVDSVRAHPWDGAIVQSAGDTRRWFVSRGVRYRIEDDTWLASHPAASRVVFHADADRIESLPEGPSLL